MRAHTADEGGTSFGRVWGGGIAPPATIRVATRFVDNVNFDRPFHLQVLC